VAVARRAHPEPAAETALRRDRQGSLSFLQGLGVGSLAAAIAAAVYSVYVYGYNRFIDDSLLRAVFSSQQERLVARGLGEAEVAQATQMLEFFTQPGPFAAVIFVQLLGFAVLCTLVLAAILRRRPVATTT